MSTESTTPPSRISFLNGERIVIGLFLAFTLYLAYKTVRPVLVVVLLAAAIASLAHPVYKRVARWLGGRKRLAAGLTVLALFVCVLGPLSTLATLVIQRIVIEATEMAQRLSQEGPSTIEEIARYLGPAGPYLERAAEQIRPRLAEAAPAIAQNAAAVLSKVGAALANLGVAVFLLCIGVYYLLLQGPTWKERLVGLLPLRRSDVNTFLERFHQVSVGVLLGNLGTALVQGTVATLGYWIFGVPVPFIWGALTALAALVPLVGTVLVWAPLSIALMVQQSLWRGLGLLLFGALIVGAIDNVVRPLLTKRGLQIHPLLIFVAIFGGIAAYGAAGIFLGPLVIALALTVLELYERRLRPTKPA